MKSCPSCKTVLTDEVTDCPNCGLNFMKWEAKQKSGEGIQAFSLKVSEDTSKKKKHFFLPFLLVALVFAAVFAIYWKPDISKLGFGEKPVLSDFIHGYFNDPEKVNILNCTVEIKNSAIYSSGKLLIGDKIFKGLSLDGARLTFNIIGPALATPVEKTLTATVQEFDWNDIILVEGTGTGSYKIKVTTNAKYSTPSGSVKSRTQKHPTLYLRY